MVGGVQFPLLRHWKLLSTTPSLTLCARDISGYSLRRRRYTCGARATTERCEAVINKSASALLASQLGADLLVIPTGVEKVAIHFGTPQRR
ncbi:hypothetical protein P1U19_21265 [Escherichia coli]